MMDIRDFGIALIRTADLDPVYVAIHDAKLPEPQLCRLLFAYFCFYHLGVAGWLSEKEEADYWLWMLVAAHNSAPLPNKKSWPRGSERRHFRGDKCIKAVKWFVGRFAPEEPVRCLVKLPSEKAIMTRAGEWPQFGPWIGFKVADMIERVYGAEIKFDPNIGLLYSSPRAALNQLAEDQTMIMNNRNPAIIYDRLLTFFKGYKAPPRYDRYCNAQEVETILCKHGSMRSGHYWVGKDILEVREALHGWGETAAKMLSVMPQEVPRVESVT